MDLEENARCQGNKGLVPGEGDGCDDNDGNEEEEEEEEDGNKREWGQSDDRGKERGLEMEEKEVSWSRSTYNVDLISLGER